MRGIESSNKKPKRRVDGSYSHSTSHNWPGVELGDSGAFSFSGTFLFVMPNPVLSRMQALNHPTQYLPYGKLGR